MSGVRGALARFGVPEEVITDNGKQFTDRFGTARAGEVLFDKICRKNGITHRLTAPASPNQNGKVERFHGTFRPEFRELAVRVDRGGAGGGRRLGRRVQHRPAAPGPRRQPGGPGGPVRAGRPRRARAVAADLARSRSIGLHRCRLRMAVVTDPRPESMRVPRRVRRSSWTWWCRRRGTCGCGGNSSGLARAGPVRSCGSGSTASGCTCRSAGTGSSRCGHVSASPTWTCWRPAVPAGPPPVASHGGPGSRSSRKVVEVERTVARAGTVSLGHRVILAA